MAAAGLVAADVLDGIHPHSGADEAGRSRLKREEIVHKEVPERHYARGDEFRQVEIQPEPVVQKVDRGVVDDQPDRRDAQETQVLARDVGIFVVERPDTVQYIIRGRCAEESQRVGHVFVQPQELLAEEPFDKIKRALSGRTGRVLSLITSI